MSKQQLADLEFAGGARLTGLAAPVSASEPVRNDDTRVVNAEQTSAKNAPNGYAGLNASSRIAFSQLGLPASATRTITHSSSPPSGGVAGDIHFQIP